MLFFSIFMYYIINKVTFTALFFVCQVCLYFFLNLDKTVWSVTDFHGFPIFSQKKQSFSLTLFILSKTKCGNAIFFYTSFTCAFFLVSIGFAHLSSFFSTIFPVNLMFLLNVFIKKQSFPGISCTSFLFLQNTIFHEILDILFLFFYFFTSFSHFHILQRNFCICFFPDTISQTFVFFHFFLHNIF